MVRAAESVVFTIVEGCGASTQKDFARFLDMAIRSTMELESQVQLALDYIVMHPRVAISLTVQIVDVRRMLCGLRKKVREADNKSADPE